jgi:hypothetical protein
VTHSAAPARQRLADSRPLRAVPAWPVRLLPATGAEPARPARALARDLPALLSMALAIALALLA